MSHPRRSSVKIHVRALDSSSGTCTCSYPGEVELYASSMQQLAISAFHISTTSTVHSLGYSRCSKAMPRLVPRPICARAYRHSATPIDNLRIEARCSTSLRARSQIMQCSGFTVSSRTCPSFVGKLHHSCTTADRCLLAQRTHSIIRSESVCLALRMTADEAHALQRSACLHVANSVSQRLKEKPWHSLGVLLAIV